MTTPPNLHLARVLVGALPALTLLGALPDARAATPIGDCASFTTNYMWGAPVYLRTTATLQRLEGGQVLDEQIASAGRSYTPEEGMVWVGGAWSVPPQGGLYQIAIVAEVFMGMDFPPTPEDLASWPAIYTFGPNTSAAFTCEAPPPPPPAAGAPRTPGYWKNHPASWSVDELALGGTSYGKQCLLTFFGATPAGGDLRVVLIHHLIAAKLNLLPSPVAGVGHASPAVITHTPSDGATIVDTIAAADLLLAGVRIDCGRARLEGAAPRGAAKAQTEALKEALDRYNNGIGSARAALSTAEDDALGAAGCRATGGAGGLLGLLIPVFAALRRRRR